MNPSDHQVSSVRPSLAGRSLGRYRLKEQIGAGGMGEVYLAHDERLNRRVAIKVIAAGLLDDDRVRERFEQEARVIAALAHPHICTLYDVGSADGVEFLVMEHLEGETLEARLARKGDGQPLPLAETFRIATQLADALAAAHRTGVVHRDLKPANVMLARTGGGRQNPPVLKVLDFGLAKLRVEPHDGDAKTATVAAPLTDVGVIVGTLPYMAPEQLQGRDADARTDIFAFGAIFYEIVTGQRAFRGDSQASLIGAILERDPAPLTSIQPNVPPEIDRLVRKCLAKEPDARWQSASDVADELRWIATGSGSGASVPPVRAGRHLGRLGAVAGGLLIALAVGAGIWKWGVARPDVSNVQHRQVTFDGNVVAAAISPDGRSVAYAVGEQTRQVRVVVRDLAGGQTEPIWTGEDVMTVAWMAEGTHVLVSGGQKGERGTWIVPRLGGSSRRAFDSAMYVAPLPDGKNFVGTIMPYTGFATRSSESRWTHVKLTGFRWSVAIDWHPRTHRVILLTQDDDSIWSVWSVASDGQEQKRLHSGKEPIHAVCSSPVSDVVYALRERGGTGDLMRISLRGGDDSTDVILTGLAVTGDINYIRRCNVSADGRRLIHMRVVRHANLWGLDIGQATEARALTLGTSLFKYPRVSPDGQWIAATRGPESDPELVKIPIWGGEPVGLGEGTGPAWSADGQRLAFVSHRSGSRRVWIIRLDRMWLEEVKDSAVVNPPVTWLPDGRLAWSTPDARNYRIRDLRTGSDEYLVKDGSVGWVFQPQFSPRGDQVALYWNRSSKPPSAAGLWLLSWPGREERRLTSEELVPIGWSADGEWIYATRFTGRAVFRVSARTGKIERVGEFPTGAMEDNLCDLTPDRSTIICSLTTEQKSDAWVIENFDPAIR